MQFVYVLICGTEWEDSVIFLSKEDAIAASIKYPKFRVEIFSKSNMGGYIPTYGYYKNRELNHINNLF